MLHANMLHRFLLRIKYKLAAIKPEKRAVTIILIGVIYLGGIIAVDQLFLRSHLSEIIGPPPDVPYYRERTQLVLDGGWLYRDLWCESPPLIVYLMIPPQLFGGDDWVYEVYFSLFQIITALSFYFGLRKWDDFKAFCTALLFYAVPYETVEATFGIQDEPVIVFFFVISLLFALNGRLKLATALMVIGIWTKVFTALLYPGLFLKAKNWRERFIQLTIIIGISISISLPFLIVAPEQFINFPRYYSLEGGAGPAGGHSIWAFLVLAGLSISRTILLTIFSVAMICAFLYAIKKNLGFLKTTLLFSFFFLIFYPRALTGYYVFPIAILLIWAVDNRYIALRCFIAYIPLFAALAFTKNNVLGTALFDFQYNWIIGLTLVLMGLMVLGDAIRRALKLDPFPEKNNNDILQ
ncbi:MAG: hypothetical protein QW087_06795 [Methanomassiliicoccales archaeon]